MHYVIQVLAAILVGTAFGALLGPRNNFLFISSLISIALGIVAIVTASWMPLAIGTAVLLLTYAVPPKTASSGA